MGKIDELTNEASAMQKPVSDIAERGGSGAIAQLIQQYCPEGVEYVKLGELCVKVCSGGTPSRGNGDYFMGNIPWLRTQEVNWNDIYDTEIKITEEAVNNSSAKIIPTNCVIIAMYGATAGKVGINKIPLTTNQACCNLQINSQKALYKYVYYCVCNEYENIKSLGQGSQNNINAQIVKDYPIPLPPLPVQKEIVRILDNFTNLAAELQTELQAELQARQQQYQYYRDTLLSFDGRDDVELVTIDQLFHRKNGYTPSKNNNDYWTGGTIPWFRMEDIRANGRILTDSIQKIHHSAVKKNGLIKAGSIIVATSATIGEHALVKVDCLTNQRFTCLTVKDEYTHRVDTMFLFYYMFKVDEWCKTHTVQGNFPGVDMSQFPNVLIPLPDIDEQRKIASILDRFDTLINDLSQGLPAEIEARQQQYEYYRDKLLTFKKKEA